MDETLFTERYALLFPGQGSQHVGMGARLFALSQRAQRVFLQADEVLGFRLSRLCFEGPQSDLDRTINTQPAVLTTSIAAFETLKERFQEVGRRLNPAFVAGHSFGEFAAAIVAEALDFTDGLRLVANRARLMQEAQESHPGGMVSVLGLDEATVRAVCAAAAAENESLTIAVDNGPGHLVLSGTVSAVERAIALVQTIGGKAIRLPIGVGAHSPLMRKAADEFTRFLNRVPIQTPVIPIISNVSAKPLLTSEDVRRELSDQFTQSVQWTRSIREMINHRVSTFVEVGPGQVLSRLVRRISDNVRTLSLAADPDLIAQLVPAPIAARPVSKEEGY